MTKRTTLRPDEYIDKRGRVRRRRGRVPECDCCEKQPAKVLMEIGEYRDDWIIKTCDVCASCVCDDCCDTDDEGYVVCILCLQDAIVAKRMPTEDGGATINTQPD